MATPEFIRRLRAEVGHELLFLSAVLAVVIDDRRVLMVRRTDTGQWTIPGGILEPGEFAPDAVERVRHRFAGCDQQQSVRPGMCARLSPVRQDRNSAHQVTNWWRRRSGRTCAGPLRRGRAEIPARQLSQAGPEMIRRCG
jgi:hypothetical protein